MSESSLRINEIFYSLQGESSLVGWPTVFIRLSGCPLRCHYCDTAYAFYEGKRMSFDEILSEVKKYSARYITITGGEPLAQAECHQLMKLLCDQDYQVSLETSGAIDVSQVDPRVIKVMDIKTPDSGEESRNLWTNLEYLKPSDQIKFVICSQKDFAWSLEVLKKNYLHDKAMVLFSPSHNQIRNEELAEWILASGLPIRFQLQMHKYIWGEVRGK